MQMDEAAQSLDLRIPWMNATGTLGFAPDPRGLVLLKTLGAFVTNPIGLHARRASQPPRQLSFAGGVLLHTGHPNPGLNLAIKHYTAAWARAPLPIIVHLFSSKPEELRKAVLRVEEIENVMAVEISVEADNSPELALELAQSAQGELPSIVQLPLHRALELADKVAEAGAAALSLGPARGALPGPKGKLISGRLYGPALFPQALETVRELVKTKLPIIAAGGVETRAQGEAMLAAGAMAVQMDMVLWKLPGLENYG
jgi:dihydroorotate dehydrogenase (NAD+) catalytic subunit